MTKLHLGDEMTGNFSTAKPAPELKGARLDKMNGILFLSVGNEKIPLQPLDDDAKNLLNNFSNETGDQNDSIYSVNYVNGYIVVVLYVYDEVIRADSEKKKVRIYLPRAKENQILSDDGLKVGRITLKANDSSELVTLLSDTFIDNKSIFISRGKNAKGNDKFQLFGKGIRADIKKERTGIYSISNFYPQRDATYRFVLSQVFGDVRFITNNEMLRTDTSPLNPIPDPHTSEVFDAWSEYMDFNRSLYESELKDKTILRYERFEVSGMKVIFHLEKKLAEYFGAEWDFLKSSELEFISGSKCNPLPSNVDEVLKAKDSRPLKSVYIGICTNYDRLSPDSKTLEFDLPISYAFDSTSGDSNGVLYLSDHSLHVEEKRRKNVVQAIKARKNETANIILRLSDPKLVDTQTGTDYKPINDEVLRKMFGNPNVLPNENYRNAMSIALNTPDIALIQGPPGTSKTTLIKGLVTRFNLMNKNYKILVSSEQHEALKNVVEKLSNNRLIPPYISSKQFDATNEEVSQASIVSGFQNSFTTLCKDILRNDKASSDRNGKIAKFVSIIQKLEEDSYSIISCTSCLDELKKSLIALNYFSDVSDEFLKLQSVCDKTETKSDAELDPTIKMIRDSVESQRTTITSFLDDGRTCLIKLQMMLPAFGYGNLMMDASLKEDLLSGDSSRIEKAMPEYVQYADKLSEEFCISQKSVFEKSDDDSPREIVKAIFSKVNKLLTNEKKDFYQIVEALMYRLNDYDTAEDIIRNYTSVIGSTCAQANKSVEALELNGSKYDVVIVDEAARANPLDLMIPVMLGTKVILVGDQKQLPHYIEENVVRKLEEDDAFKQKYKDSFLTKSIFEIIYDNLDKAYREGRIKYRRTIQISEQHRMNPVIGDFISKEFYSGTITNAKETVNKINDFKVCNGKNVAWIDVPIEKGPEKRIENKAIERQAEVDSIIRFVSNLVMKNPNRKIDLGIISFYKAQVNLLREKLKASFPDGTFTRPIEDMCNTVDSYQGKEFDIVIISGTRSNDKLTGNKALGFINRSDSRINVSLSRAKKLLVFFGDQETYSKNRHMKNFIEYSKKEGYYGKEN